MTVGARMYRVEQQLGAMDRKLDQLVHALNNITMQQQKMATPQPPCYVSNSMALPPPLFDNYHQSYQMSTASGMTAQQLQGLQLPAGPSQANTPLSSMQPHLEDDV